MKISQTLIVNGDGNEIEFLNSIGTIPAIGTEKKHASSDGVIKSLNLGFTYLRSQDVEGTIYLSSQPKGSLRKGFFLLQEEMSKSNFLGYVFLVNAQYKVIIETEVTTHTQISTNESINETKPEKKIRPEQRGWLSAIEDIAEHQVFTQIKLDKPYVIAVVNHDKPNAMPIERLREELQIEEGVKLIPCDPQNRNDVKTVLMELVDTLESSPDIENAKSVLDAVD